MPTFSSPFSGNIDRKITKTELMQAVRMDIAAELEAIFLYEAHAAATDDVLAAAVLRDIRDEEVAHVGELLTLLRHLDPAVAEHLVSGEGEVKEMMQALGISTAPAGPASIGSLIGEEQGAQ